MPRRTPGDLLPIEIEILGVALEGMRSGDITFHGFALARLMRERGGSRALTGHGTLYKALGRLEGFGLLTSRWEDGAVEGRPRRRLYELTEQGAQAAGRALAGGAGRTGSRVPRVASEPRVAGPVSLWVRLYTRGLPAPVARRRTDEIAADLHDHIAHARSLGAGDPRIARQIVSRMLRGLAADASSRGGHRRAATPRASTPGRAATHRSGRRSILGVAVATASILALPLLATLVTDDGAWTPFDFAVAGVLLGGVASCTNSSSAEPQTPHTGRAPASHSWPCCSSPSPSAPWAWSARRATAST